MIKVIIVIPKEDYCRVEDEISEDSLEIGDYLVRVFEQAHREYGYSHKIEFKIENE